MNIVEQYQQCANRVIRERNTIEEIVNKLPGYEDKYVEISKEETITLLKLIQNRIQEMQSEIDHNNILAQEG